MNPECLFLNVDKPVGPTSRQVVDQVARITGIKRLGHAGTLDPAASGVLVIAVDRGTRLVEYVQRMPKTYEAAITLGAESDTDDAEGTITPCAGAKPVDAATIQNVLPEFIGTLQQLPPRYSALKVAGRRAYELARKNLEVELQARPVVVHAIEWIDYDYPVLSLRIDCGKGTYIRALARDLGQRLGTGGYLSGLRRTAIGRFTVDRGVDLATLDRENWRNFAVGAAEALAELPAVRLEEPLVRRFLLGQRFALPDINRSPIDHEVALFDAAGHFVGIGRQDTSGTLHPTKGGFYEPVE